MFLRNVWYVAAYSSDLAPGQSLGRRYLNEPVVLFRTNSGVAYAVEDRCSHRAMPLSAGHVDGEIIRCCYHGVEFNGHGECTRIPNQDRIPKLACIRSYPIEERYGLLWIWLGEPAAANPGSILPIPEHVDPKWSWQGHYMYVKANWQLLIDNILDLTHLAYVHAGTIGGNAQAHFLADTNVIFDGKKVQLLRRMPNSIPPATYVMAGGFKNHVDRWQEVEFEPGRGMVLRVNAGACEVNTGAYEGHRDGGFMLLNIHGITPETETTTHYIWSICTNAAQQSEAPKVLFEQIEKTINEDKVVFELQQARISDTHGRFIGIASDGAVNQARRLIGSLETAEHSPKNVAN